MIKIYTDVSCLKNPGNGGWAAIINNNGNASTNIRTFSCYNIVSTRVGMLLVCFLLLPFGGMFVYVACLITIFSGHSDTRTSWK